ncbi:cytochrome P450 [Tanacetum coccineum]
MHDIFNRYGHVSDVYIAKKRNLQGKRFGFATFTRVSNTATFERLLNSTCIGYQRLRCNVARYQRKIVTPTNTHMPAKTTKTTNHHIKKTIAKQAQHSLIDLLDVFASSLNHLISSKKRYNLDEAFDHDDYDDEDYGDEDSGDEKDILVIYQLRNVPTFSSNSSSLDVNQTISIGKDQGFNMEGKEPDGAKVLGTGVDNGIQESMTCDVNPFMIKSMLGHSKFEYEVNKAFGKSGGIIAVWDPSIFSKTSSIIGYGFLALTGKWTTIDVESLIIIDYAP